MGKRKSGKQVQAARTAHCAKCDKEVEVVRVMVVGNKTTWRDRCKSCETMVD
jgi:hypothetical protein